MGRISFFLTPDERQFVAGQSAIFPFQSIAASWLLAYIYHFSGFGITMFFIACLRAGGGGIRCGMRFQKFMGIGSTEHTRSRIPTLFATSVQVIVSFFLYFLRIVIYEGCILALLIY